MITQRFGTPEHPYGPPGGKDIKGYDSVFSTAKIERELGWTARYDWRTGAKL